jgi:cytochrome P450
LLTHDNTDHLSAPGELNALGEAVFGKNSVLLLSGKQHQQRRKLIMPPFHGERMKAYGELICKITRDVMESYRDGQLFYARTAMQTITMRVILQAVFGLYEGSRYQRLEQVLSERLNLISTPLTSAFVFFPQLAVDLGPQSLIGRLRRLVAETDELLYAEIRDRRQHHDPSRPDVLSMLLAARDENGEGMTDEELHDELITLLIAGHETTATALSWALYWLHRYPETYQRLMQELDGQENPDDLVARSRLPYLNAVCNETLRIYPVGMVTLPRRVEKPCQLLGYDLQPGTMVMGSIYQVHHHPDLYPDSKVFRPERFLEKQFAPHEFLPFGGGSRRCVGAALAMYEMALVLSTTLKDYQLRLAEAGPVEPHRRGGTLAPRSGVRLQKLGRRAAAEFAENMDLALV